MDGVREANRSIAFNNWWEVGNPANETVSKALDLIQLPSGSTYEAYVLMLTLFCHFILGCGFRREHYILSYAEYLRSDPAL